MQTEKKCGNCCWYKELCIEAGEQGQCMYWPIPSASYNYTEPMNIDSNAGKDCPVFRVNHTEEEIA